MSPTELDAQDYHLGTVRVLTLRGQCDLATSEVLRDELGSAVIGQHTALVLDLTQVWFCDAGCAGQILGAARSVRTAVAAPTRPVRLVLDLLDPQQTVPRCDSVLHAAQRISPD